jgi:non-ribosomal peptide synthetase component F
VTSAGHDAAGAIPEAVAPRVTHLQCTPSMARMLLIDDEAKAGAAGLQRMLVGGEALPDRWRAS